MTGQAMRKVNLKRAGERSLIVSIPEAVAKQIEEAAPLYQSRLNEILRLRRELERLEEAQAAEYADLVGQSPNFHPDVTAARAQVLWAKLDALNAPARVRTYTHYRPDGRPVQVTIPENENEGGQS